jgi:hypothetical protein
MCIRDSFEATGAEPEVGKRAGDGKSEGAEEQVFGFHGYSLFRVTELVCSGRSEFPQGLPSFGAQSRFGQKN